VSDLVILDVVMARTQALTRVGFAVSTRDLHDSRGIPPHAV
jgi:hypothetical protein